MEVTQNFKGLNLIEHLNIYGQRLIILYRRQSIKTIPKKKKCKKAKWLSEETLQIAEERSDVIGKGERERYPSECRAPENSRER